MAQHYEGEIITENGMDYEVVDAGGGFTGWDATAAAAGGAVGGLYAHGKMQGKQGVDLVLDEVAKFRNGEEAAKGAERLAARIDQIIANPKAASQNIGSATNVGATRLDRTARQLGNRATRPFAHVWDLVSGRESVQALRDSYDYRSAIRHTAKPWENAVARFDRAVKKGKIAGHDAIGSARRHGDMMGHIDNAIAHVDDALKPQLETLKKEALGAVEHGRLFDHNALNKVQADLAKIRTSVGEQSKAGRVIFDADRELGQIIKNTRPIDDMASHASKLRNAHAGLEKGAARVVANAEADAVSAMRKATGKGKLAVIGATVAGIAGAGALAGLGHNMIMGGKEETRQVLGPHTERVMAQEARQQAANINGAPMGVAASY